VAEYASFAEAAFAMNLTKGALSQQIKRLESDLGFNLFERHARGIRLTLRGQALVQVANKSFQELEHTVQALRSETHLGLVIGTTTYFASRWLSKRLQGFRQAHPNIPLRLQPTVEPYDLKQTDIDVAIRWGKGDWQDSVLDCLFLCPAWPTGSAEALAKVNSQGFSTALKEFTLLRDKADSDAWNDWCKLARIELSYRKDTLVIPDPNVRVQAAIDGQGIGLNDELIDPIFEHGELHRLHPVALTNYGYFISSTENSQARPEVQAFIAWIKRFRNQL